MMWKNGDYEQVWNEQWKELCTNEDGSLNLDQIQRELYDYSFMLDQVPIVYCEVAGLSKPNTYASAIIGEYENRMNEYFKDYVKEIIEILQSIFKVNINDEPDYAAGIATAINEIREYANIEEDENVR